MQKSKQICKKTFDTVRRYLLTKKGKEKNYPLDSLALALQSYRWQQRVCLGEMVSKPIWPTRGIPAGSATAVAELALLLNSAINHLKQAMPKALHYVHVDDISTTISSEKYEELEEQARRAGEIYKTDFQDKAGLIFAP